jgi:hypothetical protein
VFSKINRTMFLDKGRSIDSIQKHNTCTNVPSSQTLTKYIDKNKIMKIKSQRESNHYDGTNGVSIFTGYYKANEM